MGKLTLLLLFTIVLFYDGVIASGEGRPVCTCGRTVTTDANANNFRVTSATVENVKPMLCEAVDGLYLNGTHEFTISLRGQRLFRPLQLCISSTINLAKITKIFLYDDLGEITKTKLRRYSYQTMYCVMDFKPNVLLRKITLKFSRTTEYTATDFCLVACTNVCGFSQYEDAGVEGGTIPESNIVAGWQARPGEFPWMVEINERRWDITFHECGAVLIDRRYILTSAKCVTTFDGSSTVDSSTLQVLLGEDTRCEANHQRQIVEIEEIILHSGYARIFDREVSYINDIALLKIKSPGIKKWTRNISPICMPSQPHEELVGQTATLSGWGNTFNRGYAPFELRYAQAPVMDRTACDLCIDEEVARKFQHVACNSPPEEFISRIYNGTMCAGVCGAKGSVCDGDRGGPLAIKNANGCWELLGLVSWGMACDANTPTAYTDVYFHKDWIINNTADASRQLFS